MRLTRWPSRHGDLTPPGPKPKHHAHGRDLSESAEETKLAVGSLHGWPRRADQQQMRNRSDLYQSAVISSAVGTVVAQTGCAPGQALALMETRAVETSRTLDEIAVDVAERRVHFDRDRSAHTP